MVVLSSYVVKSCSGMLKQFSSVGYSIESNGSFGILKSQICDGGSFSLFVPFRMLTWLSSVLCVGISEDELLASERFMLDTILLQYIYAIDSA